MNAPNYCINPHCPAPFPQPAHHRFCQRCGTGLVLRDRYIPRQRLGAGGFATIYTVWDQQRNCEQVLKVLTQPSEKALELFAQEAMVLRSLSHPGIPRVDDDSFFQIPTPDQPLYCVVMEKITGPTLETVLLTQYPQGCPEDLVQDWARQAVQILRRLHRRHIIHRDIKPSNLMLRSETGQVVLIDFGGAKQVGEARNSTRLFSAGYSPPEQVVGGRVEPTADIYALGRTLVHLLTGEPPEHWPETARGLDWVQPGLISPPLRALLGAMISPNVGDRPPSMAIIARRLKQLGPPHWQIQLREQGQQLRRQIQRQTRALWRRGIVPVYRASRQSLEQGVGASGGAIAGFLVGYSGGQVEQIGARGAVALTAWLHAQLPGVMVTVDERFWVVMLAGLGTGYGMAWGGLGWRSPFATGLAGALSYGVGWLFWVGMPYSVDLRLPVCLGLILLFFVGLGRKEDVGLGLVMSGAIGVGGMGLMAKYWGLTAQDWGAMVDLEDVILSYGFWAIFALLISLGSSLTTHIIAPIWRRYR